MYLKLAALSLFLGSAILNAAIYTSTVTCTADGYPSQSSNAVPGNCFTPAATSNASTTASFSKVSALAEAFGSGTATFPLGASAYANIKEEFLIGSTGPTRSGWLAVTAAIVGSESLQSLDGESGNVAVTGPGVGIYATGDGYVGNSCTPCWAAVTLGVGSVYDVTLSAWSEGGAFGTFSSTNEFVGYAQANFSFQFYEADRTTLAGNITDVPEPRGFTLFGLALLLLSGLASALRKRSHFCANLIVARRA